MIRYVSFMTVSILFLLILGCANIETEKYAPSDTDIVNRNNADIENEMKLKEFIKNTETGKKDSIRVVAYTKEGDPILTDLTFNGEQLEITEDTTRDEYGSGEINTFGCEKILVEGINTLSLVAKVTKHLIT
ncbi:DUF4362 domain-containing protein [Peribacillus muralis]|uniref:DUF4362 domain-containing protein n=1 Tax=Peribacillus muralis TaxID=264697 RepID=UPI001F4D4041|nr:DUF4362 domain-containing protein [Peribacillus muralis]MCK1995178.1 DUF4362 domain-containing protein [Peribacillus muralis]MCK2015739.1 DUF4362 domain-containing protein [Peribacillus muralis]